MCESPAGLAAALPADVGVAATVARCRVQVEGVAASLEGLDARGASGAWRCRASKLSVSTAAGPIASAAPLEVDLQTAEGGAVARVRATAGSVVLERSGADATAAALAVAAAAPQAAAVQGRCGVLRIADKASLQGVTCAMRAIAGKTVDATLQAAARRLASYSRAAGGAASVVLDDELADARALPIAYAFAALFDGVLHGAAADPYAMARELQGSDAAPVSSEPRSWRENERHPADETPIMSSRSLPPERGEAASRDRG